MQLLLCQFVESMEGGGVKAELEARVADLREAAKKYDDPGMSSTVSSTFSSMRHALSMLCLVSGWC